MKKLEAVITCVNYADFLAETLPTNRVLFDHLVVVTAPEDRATRRVCEYWNVHCIPTDAFDTRWDKFSKGQGINVGLAALSKEDWVLHLDADISCPPMMRELLATANLDATHLYGFDRHVCRGAAEWRKFLALPQLQHEDSTWVHVDKFPVAPRFMLNGQGYLPIGFAQLWNPRVSGVTKYPEQHETAARTDVQFAQQWARDRRGLIPEVVLYHLESDDASNGANWGGRTTARFGAAGEMKPAVRASRCEDGYGQ